jgi:hypothetical protein
MNEAQELLYIVQHNALGRAMINDWLPRGPENHPRAEQKACLDKVRARLESQQWYLDSDGKVRAAAEDAAKSRRELYERPSHRQ